MCSSKRWATFPIIVVLLLAVAGAALAAQPSGQWSGTVASVSGDDLALVGVPVHFRLAGGVTELLSGRTLSASDLSPGSSVTLHVGNREVDGRFRVDRAVLQPKNPLTLTGEIGRIADDRRHIEVHGVEVEIDDHTAFSGRSSPNIVHSARDLRPGTTVRMALVPTAAGVLQASEVRVTSASSEPGEDQEAEGIVTAISDTAWTIDTTAYTITDQTVFEGDPTLGDFVEVKFHTDGTGARIADRIEKEDKAPGIEVDFVGIVEAIGKSSWTISGRVVLVDASTEIVGNPHIGDTVEVEALRATDGTLTATRIKLEDPEDQEVEFTGRVESIGETAWKISGRVVLVTQSTEIRDNPGVGDLVEVRALQAADGTLTATRIKKEDDGENDANDDHGGHSNDDGSDDHGDDDSSGHD